MLRFNKNFSRQNVLERCTGCRFHMIPFVFFLVFRVVHSSPSTLEVELVKIISLMDSFFLKLSVFYRVVPSLELILF